MLRFLSRRIAVAAPRIVPALPRPPVAAIAGGAAAVVGGAATLAACDSPALSIQDKLKKPLSEMRILSLQRLMDSDGDGKLSKKEFEEIFSKIDCDGNGEITFCEWKAFIKRSGLSNAQCSVLEKLFLELDKDKSGTLTLEELQDYFHPDYAARYARSAIVAFLTKGRFIAYTSDIGESARPVMPRWFVNACYGLTFLYVGVSVGHSTYEAQQGGASQAMVARSFVHSATFELLASVAMPSLIIHQAVHFAQHQAHRLPAGPSARWAPTVVGLCCIPFLPYLDPPAEVVIDKAFEMAWPEDGTLPEKSHH